MPIDNDPGGALRSGAALRRLALEVVEALERGGFLAGGGGGRPAAVVFRVLADGLYGPGAVELEPPGRRG